MGRRFRTAAAGATINVTVAGAALDPTLSSHDVAPLDERMRREASPVGFATLMMNIAGVLALLLASLGAYRRAGRRCRGGDESSPCAPRSAPHRAGYGWAWSEKGVLVAIAAVVCGLGITSPWDGQQRHWCSPCRRLIPSCSGPPRSC